MENQTQSIENLNDRPLRFSLKSLFVFVTIVGLVLFIILTVLSAPGGRVFFSPDTLESKAQRERLLWLTEIPVYRSHFEYYRLELVEYLIAEGYWKAKRAENPRWILTYQWNKQWRDGFTDIHRELSQNANGWIEWTKANPQLAAHIWPIVLQLIRNDFQHYVGQLLHHARIADSVDEFDTLVKNDPDFVPGVHAILGR